MAANHKNEKLSSEPSHADPIDPFKVRLYHL